MDNMDTLLLFVVLGLLASSEFWRHRAERTLGELASKLDTVQSQLSVLLQSETVDPSTFRLPKSLKAKLRPFIRSGRDSEAQQLIEETLCVRGDIASRILLQLKSPDLSMELDAT